MSQFTHNTRRNTPRAPVQYQAYCDRCRRSFVHDRALEQHIRGSPRHNVCPGCDFDYITHDEMEECDCGSSAGEEEGSDVQYETGSAGTLSDDGGGEQHNGPTLAERFTNTYFSVPGAWNGGTNTDDPVNPWEIDPYGDDPYAWYDSDYGSGAESASHSGMSSRQLDESDAGFDAESDGVHSPVTGAAITPYCQRCNRQFRTQNGLHQHHRMSSLHPWYCSTCKLDHDREVELQRHNDTIHGGVPQPGSRQQPQQRPTIVPPQQIQGWIEDIATSFAAMGTRHISGASDPNTSTSTARESRWGMEVPTTPPPPMTLVEPPQIPREESRRDPALAVAGSESSKSSLVITCPLCLDNATSLTTTLCGHVFCKECITAAIQHKPECPVCRAFTHIRSLHPIFLNVIS